MPRPRSERTRALAWTGTGVATGVNVVFGKRCAKTLVAVPGAGCSVHARTRTYLRAGFARKPYTIPTPFERNTRFGPHRAFARRYCARTHTCLTRGRPAGRRTQYAHTTTIIIKYLLDGYGVAKHNKYNNNNNNNSV